MELAQQKSNKRRSRRVGTWLKLAMVWVAVKVVGGALVLLLFPECPARVQQHLHALRAKVMTRSIVIQAVR